MGLGNTSEIQFWEKVKANDLQPPAGYQIDEMVADLEHMLTSPDAHIRDELAFEILGDWVLTGHLDHDLSEFGDRLAAAMLRGIGETRTDSVFGRSFAALLIGLVIERDNVIKKVDAETFRRWLGGFQMWWELEADLRSFVDKQRGWAHAPAHGADTVASMGRSRHIATEQAKALLASIVIRLRTTDNVVLVSGEDDRLAYAAMSLLHRGDLTVQDLAAAMHPLRHVATQRGDENDPFGCPRVNTLNWLRALYLQLGLGVAIMPWYAQDGHFKQAIPQRQEMMAAVISVLREYSSWFADN